MCLITWLQSHNSSQGALPQCRPRPPQRRIAARQRSRFLILWPPECPRRCLADKFQVKGNGTYHLFAGYATVQYGWLSWLRQRFIGLNISQEMCKVQTIQTSAQDIHTTYITKFSSSVCLDLTCSLIHHHGSKIKQVLTSPCKMDWLLVP